MTSIFRLRSPISVSVAQPRSRAQVRVGKLYSVNEQVQASLIWIGYDLGPDGADGVIGSKTKAAIIAFKKEHGLSPEDATITDELMKELVAAVAAKPAPAGSPPAPKDTYKPPPAYEAGSKSSPGMSTTSIIIAVVAVLAVGTGIYFIAS